MSTLVDNLASQQAERIAQENAEKLSALQAQVDLIVTAQQELQRQVLEVTQPAPSEPNP